MRHGRGALGCTARERGLPVFNVISDEVSLCTDTEVTSGEGASQGSKYRPLVPWGWGGDELLSGIFVLDHSKKKAWLSRVTHALVEGRGLP